MGSVAEPSDQPDPGRPNPLLARERFFERIRDSGDEVLKSDEGAQIVRLKHELVLDLFLKRGSFWDEIEAMRLRWHIEASASLVPKGMYMPYPNDPEVWDSKERRHWSREVRDFTGRVVSRRHAGESLDWERFVSACILYDPPSAGLVEFAYFGGPCPSMPYPASDEAQEAMLERGGHLMMEAPPIKYLADPTEARLIEAWLYTTVLERIGERYLEPLGLNIWDLYREVWESSSDVHAELAERNRQNAPKLYIDVSETTTENDARNAFRLIRQTQSIGRKGGKPKLDPLIAVQCAVLYDLENDPDPADRRRKKWTYASLSEQCGLRGIRAAKYHVERGREILAKENRVT